MKNKYQIDICVIGVGFLGEYHVQQLKNNSNANCINKIPNTAILFSGCITNPTAWLGDNQAHLDILLLYRGLVVRPCSLGSISFCISCMRSSNKSGG